MFIDVFINCYQLLRLISALINLDRFAKVFKAKTSALRSLIVLTVGGALETFSRRVFVVLPCNSNRKYFFREMSNGKVWLYERVPGETVSPSVAAN